MAAGTPAGRDLGDPDALVEIGRSAGLDAGGLGVALDQGRHSGKVRAGQRLAAEVGVSSAPAMLLLDAGGRGRLLHGAQP